MTKRVEFVTRRTERTRYVVGDAPDELTEADVALMGGDEWEELIENADLDTFSEDEEYEQGSYREERT